MTKAHPAKVNSTTYSLQKIDVLILAGGRGTRISPVLGATPKILAPVRNETFLDILVSWLREHGAHNIILSLGHLSENVIDYLSTRSFENVTIKTSVEEEPLGTAGAIRLATPLVTSEVLLVMNGDTWLEADFNIFIENHIQSDAEMSILCTRVDDISRYGSLEIGSDGFIYGFSEKDESKSGPGYISAGIYLFSRKALDRLMQSTGKSLESDFIQKLPFGTTRGHIISNARFIDIGTPETLEMAADVLPSYKMENNSE